MTTATLEKPTADRSPDLDAIAKTIAGDITDRHGCILSSSPTNVRSNRDGSQSFILEIKGNYGPFSMIISQAWVSVTTMRIAAYPDQIWVSVNLDYTHHGGGRNGRHIGVYWMNDDNAIIEYTPN